MSLIYSIAISLMWLLVAATILHVVLDNRQPAKTMAWVLVVLFLPVVGILLYIFFGINHRHERLVSQRQDDDLARRAILSFATEQDVVVSADNRRLIDMFAGEGRSLPFHVESADVVSSGVEFYDRLVEDINRARHHVHMLMYIIDDDIVGRRVGEALAAAAARGVTVRVVYDDVGCWNVGRRFFETMRESGVDVASFMPVHFPAFTSRANYRNHRKMVVIDGTTGYIGGMNVAKRYCGTKYGCAREWRDVMLRLTGSVVYGLQRTFLIDWYIVDGTLVTERSYYPAMSLPAGGAVGNSLPADASGEAATFAQVVTSGPTDSAPEIMQGFVRIILSAKEYVWLQSPYFMPNEPVLFALKTAASAGVDVRVMYPMKSDGRFVDWASRTYLRELYEAGVSVWLYDGGFLHSKMLVSDDTVATCGSTNVDFRSFENNFEANIFLYDGSIVGKLKHLFLADQQKSVPFGSIERRLHPSLAVRLVESMARMLSPLL